MDSSILSTPFNFVASFSWRQVLLLCAASPILFLVSLYLYVMPSSLKDGRRRHLPPGPRGLPFIGNLLSLTDEEAIRDIATSWAKQYGNLFYTKIGGSDWIWLSSPKAVKDLMDKKSAIYSSRPPVPLAQDVASAGRRQLFMQYGPRYRTVRKISHNLLNINIATSYQPIQDLESKQLMVELLDNPDQFYNYNRRYSASLIIRIVYGSRIPTWDHPLIPKIYAVLNNLNDISMPGAHIVDTFPSLQYLPEWIVGNWRTYGKKVHAHDAAIYLGLYEDMKKEVAAGTAKPCFCKDFYESNPGKLGIDNLQAAYQVGGLIEAGAETTSASLNNFLLAMTKNPAVVKKAQEELDRVIGPDRLPSFSDEDKLPYIRAIVKENLRMRPPNKVGIAHATTEDDWYEGMFIPKGSQVLINWWAIHRDPSLYPEPYKFNPDRYIDYNLPAASYINIANPNDRDHMSYGAGRRVCPGIHVAERSMFMNIARILWCFDIGKKVVDGETVEPESRTCPGWMTVPRPFQCSIRVRSDRHAEVIRKTFEAADKDV